MQKLEILLFSDGGADPNPGKGGFGVILKFGNYCKEFSQGYQMTTNNRMELMGIIYGLEQIKTESNVKVYSDSQYVINAINKGWVEKWKNNNWFRNKKEKVVNSDLWARLLDLLNVHEATFFWIKGHSNHAENERCDYLATTAISGKNLLVDSEYVDLIALPSQTRKIKNAGDKCIKCNTPVIKQISKKTKRKPTQRYYYEYYMLCPSCKTVYMVGDAKVEIKNDENTLFD